MSNDDDLNNASEIRRAFCEAENRRPYQADPILCIAATPPGGDWNCRMAHQLAYLVTWRGAEVACVNRLDQIEPERAGGIAMAITALPIMDAALRAILVLIEEQENVGLIQRLIHAVLARVETEPPRVLPRVVAE